jgi:hypothetical protein
MEDVAAGAKCRRKLYTLLGADGGFFQSETAGAWGGHRGNRIYDRLDCRAARQAIARDGYIEHRLFFSNEMTAAAVGYRPCRALSREIPAMAGQARRFTASTPDLWVVAGHPLGWAQMARRPRWPTAWSPERTSPLPSWRARG